MDWFRFFLDRLGIVEVGLAVLFELRMLLVFGLSVFFVECVRFITFFCFYSFFIFREFVIFLGVDVIYFLVGDVSKLFIVVVSGFDLLYI